MDGLFRYSRLQSSRDVCGIFPAKVLLLLVGGVLMFLEDLLCVVLGFVRHMRVVCGAGWIVSVHRTIVGVCVELSRDTHAL